MIQNAFAGILIAIVAGVMIWFGITARDSSEEDKDSKGSEQN